MIYALGFTLEKVAAMQEHGIKGILFTTPLLVLANDKYNSIVYFKGTWVDIVLLYIRALWLNIIVEICRTDSISPLVRLLINSRH
jgi:hypothetical protein